MTTDAGNGKIDLTPPGLVVRAAVARLASLEWRIAMRRLTLPTVALSLMLAAPSGAADIETEIDRFQLWHACQSVGLVVEQLPDDAGKIGLRRPDIETAVRSRLRGARIYNDRSSSPYLYVNVNVVGAAFSVGFYFKRWVTVSVAFWLKPKGMDGPAGPAATWNVGSAGTHGDAAGYVLSAVARHTDKFIDEYLRVNAGACRKAK